MKKTDSYNSCSIGVQKCQCFDKLTIEQKAFIETKSIKVKFRKGEIICKQGSMASHIMFMEKGLAKVYLEDNNNILILKVIPENNLLGLSSVNSRHNTFQYSAMAYIDSEITQIEIGCFKQLLSENSEFAKEVIDILSANSVQINGRFFCLTHKQSYGKLADIILCLTDRIFLMHEFELPISRKDLAELSGMSPETVMRMLKKFNDEGIILLDGKKFKILDYDRLKQISDNG